jgi:hypothetical protein
MPAVKTAILVIALLAFPLFQLIAGVVIGDWVEQHRWKKHNDNVGKQE